MNKLILWAVLFSAISVSSVKAQQKYVFTDVKTNPVTSVKNQSSSGTCWSFATCATLESDIIKNGKGEVDLSEMWIARNVYFEKVVKYVRLHGALNLAAGGNAHDIPLVVKKYGLVPEEVYSGLNYGTKNHTHAELDAVITNYAKTIVGNPNRQLSTAWIAGLEGILDAYFGKKPEKFTYKGKEYTPMSFAQEMGINADDYVSITSFTHHPFYTSFVLEIPDNWAWGVSYNVPMAEMESILDHILDQGYTVSWASDVSDKGFLYTKGYAILPESDTTQMNPTEKDRWVSMTDAERAKRFVSADEVLPEKVITQEIRQRDFDNYVLTDDHGMQLYGVAKDATGNKFYKVKNSWGDGNVYKGHFYASAPFVLGRTMNYMVNKKALPKETKKKLGIQ